MQIDQLIAQVSPLPNDPSAQKRVVYERLDLTLDEALRIIRHGDTNNHMLRAGEPESQLIGLARRIVLEQVRARADIRSCPQCGKLGFVIQDRRIEPCPRCSCCQDAIQADSRAHDVLEACYHIADLDIIAWARAIHELAPSAPPHPDTYDSLSEWAHDMVTWVIVEVDLDLAHIGTHFDHPPPHPDHYDRLDDWGEGMVRWLDERQLVTPWALLAVAYRKATGHSARDMDIDDILHNWIEDGTF